MAAVAERITTEKYIEREMPSFGCSGLWEGDMCCIDHPSDEILAASYLRFKQEGLLPYLFYEGEPGIAWYMEQFGKRGSVEVLFVLKQSVEGSVEPVGLGWLNSRRSVGGLYDKMEIGWGAFRKFHNYGDTTRAGQLMVEFAFRYLGVAVLCGSTPEHNRAAVLAAKRIGFEMVGLAPMYTCWKGAPCGAWLSTLTKDRWAEIKRQEE